jgi:hypothetical protein
MAGAPPLDGRSIMSQLEILGNDGKPVLFASRDGESVKLEFEYYGRSPDESDLEVIYTVWSTEYDFIRERYGAEKSLEIMELLKFISNSGKGEDFRDDLRNGTIKSERFSWMSFGD